MRFFRYFLFLILALFFLGNFNQASAISDQKILISKVSNSMIEITNLGDNLSFSKIEIIQKNKIIGEISNGIFLKKSQISFGENGDGELILNPELLKSQIKLRIDGQDVDFLCGLKMTCKNKNAPEFTEEDVLVRDLNLGGDFEISKELAVCAPGYTRNPITNRCRKNSSDAKKEITPCKDGYERNPETNRCRKIVKNNGANNEVEKDEKESKQAEFTGWWAIAVVILIFLAILFFEFRRDIFAKLMKGKK